MSQAQYYAKINSIQTVICDHNYLVNEKQDRIVFHDFELDFNQLNYIIVDDFIECEFDNKDIYSAKIVKLQNENGILSNYKYSASWNKSKYSAIIQTYKFEA